MATPFTPKQAFRFDGALLAELQGKVTEFIACDIIHTLIPPLKPSATIHDNGCGYGAVTSELMATSPPAGIKITATDVNELYLAQLRAMVQERKWDDAVEAKVMDVQDLECGDEVFDLSITSFVFAALKRPGDAAKHILRTVKPGGTAVIAIWQDMTWRSALMNAHYKTRGKDAPEPPFLSDKFRTGELKKVLDEAGWKGTRFLEKTAWLTTGDLQRWARLAWSLLCAPVGGWKESDEVEWEEAVGEVVKELEGMAEWDEGGNEWRIKMDACIAVMKKEG